MDTTTASTPVASPNAARQLVAAALVQFADHHEAQLASADPDDSIREIVTKDVALARSLAAHMVGWTHTTRLREFLESETTRDEVDAHVDALDALEAEPTSLGATSEPAQTGPFAAISEPALDPWETPYARYLDVVSAVAVDSDGDHSTAAAAEFAGDVVLDLLDPSDGSAPPLTEVDLLRTAVRVASEKGVELNERITAAAAPVAGA